MAIENPEPGAPMQPLRVGDLSIAPQLQPACLRLDWRGRSAARDPGATLVPYFTEACQAAAASAAALEMHFEELEYFNSSTVSAIVHGIQLARQAGVRVVLVYRGSLRWQRLSFDALRVLGTGDDLEVRAV